MRLFSCLDRPFGPTPPTHSHPFGHDSRFVFLTYEISTVGGPRETVISPILTGSHGISLRTRRNKLLAKPSFHSNDHQQYEKTTLFVTFLRQHLCFDISPEQTSLQLGEVEMRPTRSFLESGNFQNGDLERQRAPGHFRMHFLCRNGKECGCSVVSAFRFGSRGSTFLAEIFHAAFSVDREN
jgi:hypothetical protein